MFYSRHKYYIFAVCTIVLVAIPYHFTTFVFKTIYIHFKKIAALTQEFFNIFNFQFYPIIFYFFMNFKCFHFRPPFL